MSYIINKIELNLKFIIKVFSVGNLNKFASKLIVGVKREKQINFYSSSFVVNRKELIVKNRVLKMKKCGERRRRNSYRSLMLIDAYYKKNLTKEQKKMFDITKKLYLEAELKYMNNNFKKYIVLRAGSLYSLFFNNLVMVHIIPVCVYITPISIVVSLVTTVYLYKKEKEFLGLYDFSKCNPKSYVIAAVAATKKTVLPTIVGGITIGSIVGADNIYEKITGESALTQWGKWSGYHKDSPFKK